MRQGLLWYDDDPKRSLEEKITRAGERYQQKFGQAANLCYVNPAMLAQAGGSMMHDVRVLSARHVLPGHLWIGVSTGEADEREASAA